MRGLRIFIVAILVARMNLRQLLLERFANPIGQHGVGDLRVRHHLHHVPPRQPFGEILIETAGHRQNVDAVYGRHLPRRGCRGYKHREKSQWWEALHYNHSLQVPAGESITAVIPVFNRADLLERLLLSIRAQTLAFREVLVVDNASSDGAPALARRFGCTVIEMGENAGFSRAVNRGWRAAASAWVAILNSDVELARDWAERLLASSEKAAFATGKILDARNRTSIDGTYDLLSRGACAWRAGHGEKSAQQETPSPIAIAPGTACLFRRNVLEHLRGFDESFGSYLEDIDLGLRCLRESFGGIYVPGAVAWHHGSATLGRWNPGVVRLISRNQLLLVSRHYDRALFRACLWQILTGQLLWGVLAFRHGAGFAWAAGKWRDFAISAWRASLRRRYGNFSRHRSWKFDGARPVPIGAGTSA